MNDQLIGLSDPGFRPLRDNVLVRRCEAEQTTSGGIMLPDTARMPADRASVVALGPGRRTQAGDFVRWSIAVGDDVMVMHDHGVDVMLGRNKFAIINENDVLGVFAPPQNQYLGEPPDVVSDEPMLQPAQREVMAQRVESLETDVAPDILDRETPGGDDLH